MWDSSASQYQVVDTLHRLHRDAAGCHWLDVTLEVQTQTDPGLLQLWLFREPLGSVLPPSEHRAAQPGVTRQGDFWRVSARFRLGVELPCVSFRPVVGDGSVGGRGFLIALGGEGTS